MEIVIISLIVFLVFQQVVFLLAIHKLVDKVMSGTYSDYVASETRKKSDKKVTQVRLPPEEDMGIMQDFASIP